MLQQVNRHKQTQRLKQRRISNGIRGPKKATLRSECSKHILELRAKYPLQFHREDTEEKKAEAARKKKERDAQLAEEEASQSAKPKGANAKTAQKKTRGLDLGQLEDTPTDKKEPSISASGIENALDALSLASKDTSKVEKHPERRFKAAYAAFEERRLPEIEEENPGLRRQQRIALCRKEFDKSEENPFNQVHANVNATKEELAQLRENERKKLEDRLGGEE